MNDGKGKLDDLSRYHYLVSNLFDLPKNTVEWSRFRLSEKQVQFFHQHGYLTGIPILDERQLGILREELAQLTDPSRAGHELFYEYHSNESKDPKRVLFHALGAWRITPGFHDLLWHPAFTVPASQLLGGPVRFWHDQLFCKPARHGGVVAWHQDYSYWTRTTPLAHLTCWIGLDETSVDNGCLYYVPGSHLWPDLPRTGLTGDMDAVRSVLPDNLAAQFNPVPIELKAGQCSFHHPRMMHGSFQNNTSGPRRGTVINALLDGVMSNSEEPLLKDVPVIPIGRKLSGRFFPLLFEPNANSSSEVT